MKHRYRSPRARPPRSTFGLGLVVLALGAAVVYLGFAKSIPLRSHFEVQAVFRNANNLRPGSPVRVAGVEVGKVTEVAAVGDGEEAARVTMRVRRQGRPIHEDAILTVRPRIFLEGNFFVDVEPGTPRAPELGDGDVVPIAQTRAPVQLGQILEALQSDTRQDLRLLLRELDRGLDGAEGYRRSIPYWEPAYRDAALVNDATLGQAPHDLSEYLRGAARTADGLDRDPRRLQDLVTDFRRTAGALAARDRELSAAIAELPRTLRAGLPALRAVDDALPSVRAFARELRPGVRSSGPAIDAAIPLARQVRGLVGRPELRGLSADLRPTVPALTRLNRATVPLLEQVREASGCQNEVILPWTRDKIEDEAFPSIGPVYQEQTKPLVGLAGESRSGDANSQWFRVAFAGAQYGYEVGGDRFLLLDRPLLGVNPPPPPTGSRSPLRPDVPCETQEAPDLRTRPAPPPRGRRIDLDSPAAVERGRRALERTTRWVQRTLRDQGLRDDLKVADELLKTADLPRIARLRDR